MAAEAAFFMPDINNKTARHLQRAVLFVPVLFSYLGIAFKAS
jgi:hypothetical protein